MEEDRTCTQTRRTERLPIEDSRMGYDQGTKSRRHSLKDQEGDTFNN